MPIDINLLREYRGGNPELVRESQRRRFASVELVDQIIAKDEEWRVRINDAETARKKRNAIQQEVGKKKKAKEPCDELVAQIQAFDKRIIELEALSKASKEELDKLVPKIGNIVDDSVPVSQDEEADTEVVRTWGTPRTGDDLIHHHDLLWRLGGFEPERGSAIAGHRAYFLRDAGLLLNQALINYGIAFLRKRNYSVIQPPYFMNRDVMAGVAQLEQFDEELYKVTGDDDKYLIATSEQPICGFHKGEWIDEKSLPLKYGGISTCFRKEAGAHGKDCWGIFRVHQFDKVEQFVLCDGDLEVSRKVQEEMIAAAEEFYRSIGIAYRVVNIVSGELNNAAIKKYDLEGWFPGYDTYRELVSCSNCTDYQSRSMEIRCGVKKLGQDTKKYVHMLNSTLCACTRTICAILENFQTPEGVRVPDVLVPFMGGLTFLPFVREPRKDAAAAKAADRKKAAPAKTPAAPKAAPPGAPSSKAEALAIQIVAKGEEIRQLKASKADKTVLQPHVDALLALKKQYKETTGADYVAGGAPPVVAKANGTAPTAKAPSPAPAPAPSKLTGKAAEIGKAIIAKGEEIRQLKASKADKTVLDPQIKALLELKQRFKNVTGHDYAAPGQAAAPSASSSKKEKKAPPPPSSVPTNKKAAPSPAPAVKPAAPVKATASKPTTTSSPTAYTVPASFVKASDIKGPLFDQGGKPNFMNLNAYLHTRSYVRGFLPSQDDVSVFKAVDTAKDLGSQHPHLARWYRHIAAYSEAERAAWPK